MGQENLVAEVRVDGVRPRGDGVLAALRSGIRLLDDADDFNRTAIRLLALAGTAVAADRSFLLIFEKDKNGGVRSKARQEWCAPGLKPGSVSGWNFDLDAISAIASGDPATRLIKASGSGPLGTAFEALGLHAVGLVPIRTGGETWGALGVAGRHGRIWLDAEIVALETFAGMFGFAASRSGARRRRVAKERERAIIVGFSLIHEQGHDRPDKALRWLVEALTDRYAHPAKTVARVVIDKTEFRSHNFQPPRSAQVAEIAIDGQVRGTIEIGSIDETAPAVLTRDDDEQRIFAEEIGRQIAAFLKRLEVERKLAFENTILATEHEASPDGILVADDEGRIVSCNRRLFELWGIPSEPNAPRTENQIIDAAAPQLVAGQDFVVRLNQLRAHRDATAHDTFDLKDGRTFDAYSSPMTAANGTRLGRVWFFRDVSELRRHDAEISRVAHTDTVTGLFNRALFVEHLAHAFAELKRGGEPFAVHYLDIDRFKDANDAFGHPNGDLLLAAVARRLRSVLRESDFLARLGGDEFAILQPRVADTAMAGRVAAKLIEALKDPFAVAGNEIHLTASIGIALSEAGHGSPDDMLVRADLALYRAKGAGGDQYHFHIESLDRQVRERVALSEDLYGGLRRGEFELHYQSQIEIATGKVVGFEALARWHHPSRGLVPPIVFIPLAEKMGLIRPLGEWVIAEACRQMRLWIDEGIAPAVVAVNLSGAQLRKPAEFVQSLSAMLRAKDIPPQCFELELTETVLMETTREHNDFMERLRALGIRTAIDDFGTGYSSLDYLRSYRVSRLKIAQEFVRNLTRDKGDAAIVRAIIGLARELEIEVIAEGIETEAQLDFLVAAGCRFGQGFYFSKPIEAARATELLKRGISARASYTEAPDG